MRRGKRLMHFPPFKWNHSVMLIQIRSRTRWSRYFWLKTIHGLQPFATMPICQQSRCILSLTPPS